LLAPQEHSPSPSHDPDVGAPLAAQKRYQNSPARNTPECQEILTILTNHGYGVAQLEEAYNLAIRAHLASDEMINSPNSRTKINGVIYDPGNAEHVNAVHQTDQLYHDMNRQKLILYLRPSPGDESYGGRDPPDLPQSSIFLAARTPLILLIQKNRPHVATNS
jgi:hypothetical protein